MYRTSVMVLAVAAALGLSQAVNAATEDDLKDLREHVRQLKELYQTRIEALERRLQQAEASASQAQAVAGRAQTTANQAAVQAGSRPAGENAMNPAMSLTLNGVYSNLSQDPKGYRIKGFVPPPGEVGPPRRGLSLGESELAISASVDPYFKGTLFAALAPDNSIAVEEGYIQTIGLSAGWAQGLTVKAGRFRSGIGYLNEIHPHAWDFADAPLASKAFLGGALAEDGVQFKWIAPTDLYLDVGLELGRGRGFPAGPEGGRNKNGLGSSNMSAHAGGDVGDAVAWRLGFSHLRTTSQNRVFGDVDSTGTAVANSFAGSSRLWVVDGILKWAPNGNSTDTNFKLQGEYFRRGEDGNLTYDSAAASLGRQTGRFVSWQSGWYLQGVYQFMPRWRFGYRYDRLNPGTTTLGLVGSGALGPADFPILENSNPTRHTLMTDWSGSEFSRIRLQFARDQSRAGATDNQVLLQYIVSLGAHGAHKF